MVIDHWHIIGKLPLEGGHSQEDALANAPWPLRDSAILQWKTDFAWLGASWWCLPNIPFWKWCTYILVSDGVTGFEVFPAVATVIWSVSESLGLLVRWWNPKNVVWVSLLIKPRVSQHLWHVTRSFHDNTWLLTSTSLPQRYNPRSCVFGAIMTRWQVLQKTGAQEHLQITWRNVLVDKSLCSTFSYHEEGPFRSPKSQHTGHSKTVRPLLRCYSARSFACHQGTSKWCYGRWGASFLELFWGLRIHTHIIIV